MGHFLFLEPYYSGSHKYFADGLLKNSNHKIDLLTLPARFWKWRMRGAALYFAGQIDNPAKYDGIITTNMLSLSDLKAIWNKNAPPFILYFHENQILYPLSEGEKEDLHYGFTDITSALAADYIYFNSNFHKTSFLSALEPFLKRMPDKKPFWIIEEIKKKSKVLYPGCNIQKPAETNNQRNKIPIIVWNHRWEHDKNPKDFFKALYKLKDENIDFKLAVLGEQYKKAPEIFNEARIELKENIECFGFQENYNDYKKWLYRSNIIISTAYQENFGISIVEGIACGCFPLLPNRLSYRELIPKELHNLCIYKNQNDFIEKLKNILNSYNDKNIKKLINNNYKFSWDKMKHIYDNELDQIIYK